MKLKNFNLKVNTEHHHKPSDITNLANKFPHTQIVITHTYIDSDYKILTKDVPIFPENVIHGEDNMEFTLDTNGSMC